MTITKELMDAVNQYLKDNNVDLTCNVEFDSEENTDCLTCEVHDGDWKHEHAALRFYIQKYFDEHPTLYLKETGTRDYEGSEGDWYSQTYMFYLDDKKNQHHADESVFDQLDRIDDDRALSDTEEVSEALAANEYKLVYHYNSAARDRRPETKADLDDDWTTEVFQADSDLDAWKEAFNKVKEDYTWDEYFSDSEPTEKDFVDFFEDQDWGDGSPILISLKSKRKTLFNTGYTKTSWKKAFWESVDTDVDDEYSTDFRYYVYDADNNCVSDPFDYQDDAEEFALENNYPAVKIHRYYRDTDGDLNPDGDPEVVWKKVTEGAEEKICCICEQPFKGYGNNAAPVCDGICCDMCNLEKVIPARFARLKGNQE